MTTIAQEPRQAPAAPEHAVQPGLHVMAKPVGARCNLNCAYCFFLAKESLYPGGTFRMSDEVMESYIRQTIEAQPAGEVTIAWQGGEPTLMGIDFYRRAVEVSERHRRPGVTIQHTIQTNGILLDDEWCTFLREAGFLVGISLDGPQQMHDRYRRDRAGQGTFGRVVSAIRLMQRHEVRYNALCAVHAGNSQHPLAVYRFLRDELGARYCQFIPIVERAEGGGPITSRSVSAESYGRFLIRIFDEWVRRDVGRVFVQLFDATLASGVGPFVPLYAVRNLWTRSRRGAQRRPVLL